MAKPCVLMCCKIFLVVFNMIFLLCGAAILGVGVWMHFDQSALIYMRVIQGAPSSVLYDKVPYLFIGIGAAITLLCFLGCCGACAESICFLCLYSTFLLVVLVFQIVTAILAGAFHEKVRGELESTMQAQVRYHYNRTELPNPNTTDYLTLAWDTMQVKLNCCGSVGPGDYMFSYWFNHTRDDMGDSVPDTCCVLYKRSPKYPIVKDPNHCQMDGFLLKDNVWPSHVPPEARISEDLHAGGCYAAVMKEAIFHVHYVIAVVIIAVVLQIVGFILSCVMIVCLRKIHDKSTTWEEDS